MDKDNDAKLKFFDDIKTQFFLVLGGIVSLSTVIPAFLNSTSEIFGFSQIKYGYYLFVFIYFIVPYLFYLFYCSTHDEVGYLELLPKKILNLLRKKNLVQTFFGIAYTYSRFFLPGLALPCL